MTEPAAAELLADVKRVIEPFAKAGDKIAAMERAGEYEVCIECGTEDFLAARDLLARLAERPAAAPPPEAPAPEIESRYAGVTLKGSAAKAFREQIGNLLPAPAAPGGAGWRVPMMDFARKIIKESWEVTEVDSAFIQDEALKAGLIIQTKYDPEKHGESDAADIGDKCFVLSEVFAAAPPPPEAPEPDRGERCRECGYGILDSNHHCHSCGHTQELGDVLEDFPFWRGRSGSPERSGAPPVIGSEGQLYPAPEPAAPEGNVCPECEGTGLILEHPAGVPFSQSLAAMDDCLACNGTGSYHKPASTPEPAASEGDCPWCDGRGFGTWGYSRFQCQRCNGTGRFPEPVSTPEPAAPEKKVCQKCEGTGYFQGGRRTIQQQRCLACHGTGRIPEPAPAAPAPDRGERIEGEFKPCGIYFPDSDVFEIVLRDTATVYDWIPGTNVSVIRAMVSDEIIGLQVEQASRLFKPTPAAPATPLPADAVENRNRRVANPAPLQDRLRDDRHCNDWYLRQEAAARIDELEFDAADAADAVERETIERCKKEVALEASYCDGHRDTAIDAKDRTQWAMSGVTCRMILRRLDALQTAPGTEGG